MMRSVRPCLLALCFFSAAMLSFCPGLRAQENCNVEVKLLLSANETQAVVAALGARKETKGRVYFYDTDALELLAQGAIVRLRRNTSSDLTVKFRPHDDKKFLSSAAGLAGFKCEIDLTGDGENASYSITSPFAAQHLPQAGFEIPRLLNAAQMTLFPDAQVSVDWTRVKRLSKIISTGLADSGAATVGQAGFGALGVARRKGSRTLHEGSAGRGGVNIRGIATPGASQAPFDKS